ncbi:DUF6296 family protein [Streptacidiphilus jiangxiensis]|uniref:Uncharacterized protein n=1 Tax=Streptacidiphilus jiangxiensis TaxID=235985 RepID=A0A1H7HKX5_STRJI|nr:DUF6296 family protein [Streptacidiphilus jiangxiensis]SEK50919.1 hypothetical protein SAMN05414137_102257 [Streptacidiphilus jiangxiensis]
MARDDGIAYELVFRSPGDGSEDVVVVHATGATGPGGHPVYADASGIIRAEISDRAEARMLPTGGHQALPRPVACRTHRDGG